MEPTESGYVENSNEGVSSTPLRLCGPRCPTPDLHHGEPELTWEGDVLALHGESTRVFVRWGEPGPFGGPRYDPSSCLCGHPDFETCPGWLDQGSMKANRPGDDIDWTY